MAGRHLLILCDKYRIDATFSSNHTLQELWGTFDENDEHPSYLHSLLKINQNNPEAEAARQKII